MNHDIFVEKEAIGASRSVYAIVQDYYKKQRKARFYGCLPDDLKWMANETTVAIWIVKNKTAAV